MSGIQIFVISLLRSEERRNRIQAQFSDKAIDFEFFDAIDGRKEAHPLFEKQDLSHRIKLCGIPLLPGELGCFASHYLLWQRCVELQQPIVVIEDDAELKDSFTEFLPHFEELAETHKYLRLFENEQVYRKRVTVEDLPLLHCKVVRYLKGPASTRAYLLHPVAAEKFIAHASKWYKPVDDYMDEFWINGVECKGLVPGIVNDETVFGSEIKQKGSGRKNRSFGARLEREWMRICSNFRRLIYNLSKVIKR